MPSPFDWEICQGRWGWAKEIVEALNAGTGDRVVGRKVCSRGQFEVQGRVVWLEGGKIRGPRNRGSSRASRLPEGL